MPTYDYVCKNCGHRFEAFQTMMEDALSHCPKCGIEALQRLIGAGAGLIFKGSGFYLTDYKKSKTSPASSSASSTAAGDSSADKTPAAKDSATGKSGSGT
jgi:putative FmdB family regulatory protein